MYFNNTIAQLTQLIHVIFCGYKKFAERRQVARFFESIS